MVHHDLVFEDCQNRLFDTELNQVEIICNNKIWNGPMEAMPKNSKGLIHVHNSLTPLSTFFDCDGSDLIKKFAVGAVLFK